MECFDAVADVDEVDVVVAGLFRVILDWTDDVAVDSECAGLLEVPDDADAFELR